jgi:hypothetical protein
VRKKRALGHARAQHNLFNSQGLEAFFSHEFVCHRDESGARFQGSLLDGLFHGVQAIKKSDFSQFILTLVIF